MSAQVLVMAGVLLLFLIGLWQKNRRWLHVTLMLIGIVATFAFVVYFEVSQGASQNVLDQALGEKETRGNKALLFCIHIPTACLMLLNMCYMLASGFTLLLKADIGPKWRKRHKVLGIVCLGLYVLTLASCPGFLLDQLLLTLMVS